MSNEKLAPDLADIIGGRGAWTTEWWTVLLSKALALLVLGGVLTLNQGKAITEQVPNALLGISAIIAIWKVCVHYGKGRTEVKLESARTGKRAQR
jgi:hypothetical protein